MRKLFRSVPRARRISGIVLSFIAVITYLGSTRDTLSLKLNLPGRTAPPIKDFRTKDKDLDESPLFVDKSPLFVDESPLFVNESPLFELQRSFPGDRVVIYEQGVHDEVVGALAYTLHEAGVDPLLICQFRFSFAQVLDDIYPARTESPYGASASIHKRLEENSIEYLILSTCSSSLPLLKESILRSNVHVICVVHHSGPDVYHKQKKDWTPLAEQGRLTLLLLGHHVALEIKKDVEGWAEQEESYIWENLPVHVLLPIFPYTPSTRPTPLPVFPSRAVVQGNIEHGRRNYQKLFDDLQKSILQDAGVWGYERVDAGSPAVPRTGADASPFQLLLLGQRSKYSSLTIPVELENVIQIHEGLAYPEFYAMIAASDVILPAFAQAGAYFETTSSSIAASVITRVPVLGSSRLLRAYSYLNGPAVLLRDISESEISALRRIRSKSAWRRAEDVPAAAQWQTLHDDILAVNLDMWRRVLI